MSNKPMFTDYGFSTPQSEIEEILGLPPDALARTGYDIDLADDCRWLLEHGVDLSDEAAVRKAHAMPTYANVPRYVDALVRVAADFWISARADLRSR
ncbi:MAG: hypothetical protein WAV72_24880 [Bradyrhizobium sp.]